MNNSNMNNTNNIMIESDKLINDGLIKLGKL